MAKSAPGNSRTRRRVIDGGALQYFEDRTMSDDRIQFDTAHPAAEGLRYACLQSQFIDDLNIGLFAIEAASRLGVSVERSAPVVCGILADLVEARAQRMAQHAAKFAHDSRSRQDERNAEDRRRQINLLRNASFARAA